MFKFVEKKHVYKDRPEAKFVIYYSVPDIILGILLMGLVLFFAWNYVQNNAYGSQCQQINSQQAKY